jgi:hypothetical protein
MTGLAEFSRRLGGAGGVHPATGRMASTHNFTAFTGDLFHSADGVCI